MKRKTKVLAGATVAADTRTPDTPRAIAADFDTVISATDNAALAAAKARMIEAREALEVLQDEKADALRRGDSEHFDLILRQMEAERARYDAARRDVAAQRAKELAPRIEIARNWLRLLEGELRAARQRAA